MWWPRPWLVRSGASCSSRVTPCRRVRRWRKWKRGRVPCSIRGRAARPTPISVRQGRCWLQRVSASLRRRRLNGWHKPMCAVRGFCSPWAPLRSRSWIRLAPEGMPHGPNWPLLAPTKRQARRVLPPPVRCCQMKGGQVFPVVLARSWPSRRRLRGASSSG